MASRYCSLWQTPEGTLIIDNGREWARRLADAMGNGTQAVHGGVQGFPDYSAHRNAGCALVGEFLHEYSTGAENGWHRVGSDAVGHWTANGATWKDQATGSIGAPTPQQLIACCE